MVCQHPQGPSCQFNHVFTYCPGKKQGQVTRSRSSRIFSIKEAGNDSSPIYSHWNYSVRQAKESETAQIAMLCSQVFGPMTFQNMPAFVKVPQSLIDQAGIEILKDVEFQLGKALKGKLKATQEAREYKLSQMSAKLRNELAQISGGPSFLNYTPAPLQRQALRRWNRNRQFICLIAEHNPHQPESHNFGENNGSEEKDQREIVGCVVVSILAPEAILPPPFPSSAPLRCCISNLATAQEHRHQGIAKALIQRCETIARRWGFSDIWLHTDVTNLPAQNLYDSCGFIAHKRDPSLLGPFRRILYRKNLMPLGTLCQNEVSLETQLERSSSSQGTYQWNISQK